MSARVDFVGIHNTLIAVQHITSVHFEADTYTIYTVDGREIRGGPLTAKERQVLCELIAPARAKLKDVVRFAASTTSA